MVERIRLLLEARQFTPTQFADAIGVARPIVSHILSGRNKPSLEVVQRILAAMPDLSMSWLLNGTGPMHAAPAAPLPPTLQPPKAAQLIHNELISASVPEQADRASIPASASTSKGQKITATPGAGAGPALSVRSSPPSPGRFKTQKLESASVAVPSPGPSEPSSLPLAAPAAAPISGQAFETAAPAGSPAALDSRLTSPTATALFSGGEKPIRRIVIFYRDGSFADYQPE
ncbi:helix-turn-helix transcriptional regulator [Hymenobacter sp.]|uniref:helix-turn-helix domain-containing protein n=1 Tax=Hymenobacter sp. TaxID=1898978 RepID=UPI00286B8DE0|nr:helix-turn-helix transcriptional regulator [Hymenobacter sp.]